MKVKIKKLEDGVAHIVATATVAEVGKAFDAAEAAFAETMGLKPDSSMTAAQAIRSKLGITDIDEVIRGQVPEMLVPYALDMKDLTPAFPPKAEYKRTPRRNHPLEFETDVTLKPDYELTSYDPVDITVEPFVFDESEVKKRITQLAEQSPTFEPTDPHPVESGDIVLIAMEATRDGQRMEGLCTDARTYATAQGYMPDGFDEGIIGMDVGETKTFTFEAPDLDDLGNEVVIEVEATVTVKEQQIEVLPEITDEWVKMNMPVYANADELVADLRKTIEKNQREKYDAYVRSVATAALSERFEGHILDEVYENTAVYTRNSIKAGIAEQGGDFDEFVKQQGGEDQFRMGMMLQVRQQIRADYSLDAVFRHEGLEISDDDIHLACKDINPRNPSLVRQQMLDTGRGFALREVAARYAAAKWVVAHANITYQEGKGAAA